MKNKYQKLINRKLSIGVCIITVIILSLLISGCSNQLKSHNTIKPESTTTKISSEIKDKEVGPIPTWVKWNNKTYKVTGETVSSVEEKLGVSESTSLSNVQRDIYSIPNVSSDKEIAIEQLGKTYFKAFINK